MSPILQASPSGTRPFDPCHCPSKRIFAIGFTAGVAFVSAVIAFLGWIAPQ